MTKPLPHKTSGKNLLIQRHSAKHKKEKAKLHSVEERLSYDLGRSLATRKIALAIANPPHRNKTKIPQTFGAEEILEVIFNLIEAGEMSVEQANRMVESLRSLYKKETKKLRL